MKYKLLKYLKKMEFNILNLIKFDRNVSLEELSKLQKYYCIDKPLFNQNVNVNIKYDLMVIVPVYNTEKYLEECIESLINQKTKYSYQIVLIDDGSTDSCCNILEKYEHLKYVKIIRKENGGISSARNIALKNITGEYIMFVDSDDYVPSDCIDTLLNIALKEDYDIVEGSYSEINDDCIKRYIHDDMNISKNNTYGYPWGKVIKYTHFLHLSFPEKVNFEDSIIKTLLIPQCKKVITISHNVYNYRINNNSISHVLQGNKKAMDTFYLTIYILEEQKKRNIDMNKENYIYFLNQVRLNYLRLKELPENIQKIVFYLSCDLLDIYFKHYVIENVLLINLRNSLEKRNYISYSFLMKNWFYVN